MSDRPLDQRGPRTDVCPGCGGERQEIPMPDQFYCDWCKRASAGPNEAAPEAPQEELFA
jgi:hypothetical protein